MNKQTIKTITKSIIIILVLMAIVFALRAPAADLNFFDEQTKLNYVDDSGLPYFSEMDSYYNLRLTQNYVDHGYIGDIKYDNGTVMDMHRIAPDGHKVDDLSGNGYSYEKGIVYVTSFLHNIANMFGSYSVKETAFWAGAIIATLAVIPAFIFARRLTNDYGAITAALIIGLAPNYFAHTFPGFFDTDMFYYIFPLFFIFFFIEAMRTDNRVLKIVFALLSVLSIGLFSQAWTGYVFYIGVIAAFVVVYLIAKFLFKVETDEQTNYSSKLQKFIHDKDVQSIIFLVVLGVIVVGLFKGFELFTSLWNTALSLLTIQSATGGFGGSSGFPNVLISVAEMQAPALLGAGMGSAFLANSTGVVNGLGGITVLFAGLFALYNLLSRVFKLRKVDLKAQPNIKPKKAERKAASKKLDDKSRFKFSLKDIGKFDSQEELYSVRRINLIYTTLFVVWVIVSIIAVSRGSRFITTLVLPFALLTGIFVGHAVDYVKTKNIKQYLSMGIVIIGAFLISYPLCQIMVLAGIVVFLLLVIIGAIAIYGIKGKTDGFDNLKRYLLVAIVVFALISPSICGAYQTSNQVVPGTSDPMWNSMVWVDQNMPEDTVITSWWDFGYLFEISADRQTTFDGGSQSGERAFWLGKAMSTDDLELSAGIFRMLNTKGGAAIQDLSAMGMDNGTATKLLCEILPLPASEAKTVLVGTYHFSDAQANKLLEDTHPANPRPTIFVSSSDMIQKAGWWSYFGNWDFKNQNSTNYQYFIPYQQYKMAPNTKSIMPLFNDSGICFNVVVDRSANNTTATTQATFENGTPIKINGTEYNPLKIGAQIIVENGVIVKNETISGANDANYTLLLLGYPENENSTDGVLYYTPIVMSNELVNSMFTQLYLLGGAGQNIFVPVHVEPGVSLWYVNYNATAAGGGTSTSTTTTTK